MKSGFEGHSATMEDWKTHLNTLFPEVRLKKTIEVRGADVAVDGHGVRAACALDGHPLRRSRARGGRGARRRTGPTTRSRSSGRARGVTDLRATFRGKPLAAVAERAVAIAEGGLERRAIRDVASGKDERVHLARLRKLVGEGRCPADALLEGLDREKDPAQAMMERATLR